MKKFISLVAGLLLGAGMLFAQAPSYTDLIISQYVEGKVGNNKYIELYNGTGQDIDLSAYTLKQNNTNSSGANDGTWKYPTALSGTIKAGEVFIFYNSQCGAELTEFFGSMSNAVAVTASNNCMGFNGNDPIALFKGDDLIDVIGTLGSTEDYGKDVNMIRKCDATAPKTTYDPADWDVTELTSSASDFNVDEYTDGAGIHCGSAPAEDEDAPEVDMIITSISEPRLITVQFNENIQQVWEAFVMDMTEEDDDYDIDSLRVRGKQLLIYVNRDMVAGHSYLVSADEVLDMAGNDTWLEEEFYFGYQDVADVAELMAMREAVEAGEVGAQKFRITGDVVITAMFGKNIYIQDKDCANVKGHSICLYDAKSDAIPEGADVKIGTVVNGVIGELTIYNGLFEMNYIEPGCVTGTEVVEPVAGEATIYNVLNDNQYHSALVKFKNVEFTDAGGTFAVRKTYGVEDEDNTINLYTQTDENADFIGMTIPSGKGSVIGYITVYNNVAQVCPRTKTDIFPADAAVERNQAVKFNVYPNPATDALYLDVKASNYTVSLYNLSGMEVARTGRNAKQLNLNGLAKGMYMVAVKTDAGVSYSKVIVK